LCPYVESICHRLETARFSPATQKAALTFGDGNDGCIGSVGYRAKKPPFCRCEFLKIRDEYDIPPGDSAGYGIPVFGRL
jgi:hypothetical protein